MYAGDFAIESVFDLKFTTVTSTGAPITLAGTPAVAAYPGNSVTEITAGITLTVDFDARTGLHNVRVVATAANGYAAATNYALVLTAGTVDGVSVVGYVVAHFSLDNRSALRPTVAARTLDVSAGGEAGVDWANVGTPGSTVNLSATTTNVVNTATAVTTVNGLAANIITAASIATGAIDADAIADNAIDAGSIATGAIAAAKFAAGAIDAAAIAADAGTEIAAAVWDRVLTGATHNIANSAGRRLRILDGATIRDGTAQAGAANSITLDAGASATNEIYDENLVIIVAGTGAGQTRRIAEYNGTSKVAIVDRAWEVTPDATSEFIILGAASEVATHHGVAQAGAATTITLAADASATNDIYNGSTIVLRTSTGAGQARLITAYNGTTKVATITPAWTTNPGATSVYRIIPVGRVDVQLFGGVEGTFSGGRPEVNTTHAAGTVWGSGAITAAAIADAAIDAATFAAGAINAAAIADGAIDAATFAADALTAAALAADAVAEIQSGLSTLTAAGVRTAVGLASANLDTQLDALPTAAEVWAAATRTLTSAANITSTGGTTVPQTGDSFARIGAAGVGLTNIQLPATGLDMVLVDGKTLPRALAIIGGICGGKISGAGTGTEVFLGFDGATTAATVTVDGSGNRTAVTY